MNISIKGTNIDLTEDIKMYVRDKINSLEKYFNNIIDVRVEVGLISAHHQKGKIFFCEVNVKVPGDIIMVKKTEKALFKAIDKTKDHLRVTLHRHKEKLQDRNRVKERSLDIGDIEEMEAEI